MRHPDHYTPPQTIEEARERIRRSTEEIRDIELKLTHESRQYPDPRDRSRMRSKIQHHQHELSALRAWVGQRVYAENEQRRQAKEQRRKLWLERVDDAQHKSVVGVVEMMRELYAVAHCLVGRAPCTENEQDVLDSVRDFLNAWDYPREPLNVGPQRRGSLRNIEKEPIHG